MGGTEKTSLRTIQQRKAKVRETACRLSGILPPYNIDSVLGSKFETFLRSKTEELSSPDEIMRLWLAGMEKHIAENEAKKKPEHQPYTKLRAGLLQHEEVREYFRLYMTGYFVKYSGSLTRYKPDLDSAVWLGSNANLYGLFIVPVFEDGAWKNDRSDVRHFPSDYWTVGHALTSGLVFPRGDRRIMFASTDDLIAFLTREIIVPTQSIHQVRIFDLYAAFVRRAPSPESIALLMPEVRFDGLERQHKYRVDFCVFDRASSRKWGFELSPWSTHGDLRKCGSSRIEELNTLARNNFEYETRKTREFLSERGVAIRTFTDSDLKDPEHIFSQHIEPLLLPQTTRRSSPPGILSKYGLREFA